MRKRWKVQARVKREGAVPYQPTYHRTWLGAKRQHRKLQRSFDPQLVAVRITPLSARYEAALQQFNGDDHG